MKRRSELGDITMKYIVLFTDNPAAAADIRAQIMPRHLAYLEAHGATILAAGPLRTEAGAGAGGLWLVEAETVADVEVLIRGDPFWPSGLRHSHQVLEWRQVFLDGERQI